MRQGIATGLRHHHARGIRRRGGACEGNYNFVHLHFHHVQNKTEEGGEEEEEKEEKSEKYWGQRQNGWAGAVMVGRGGYGGQVSLIFD